MRLYLAAIVLLAGCSSIPRQEIEVNDLRVSRIAIEGNNSVQRDCGGGYDDHGARLESSDQINGCYIYPNGPIIISSSADFRLVWRHELCHAITDLKPWECDNLYPAPSFSRIEHRPRY